MENSPPKPKRSRSEEPGVPELVADSSNAGSNDFSAEERERRLQRELRAAAAEKRMTGMKTKIREPCKPTEEVKASSNKSLSETRLAEEAKGASNRLSGEVISTEDVKDASDKVLSELRLTEDVKVAGELDKEESISPFVSPLHLNNWHPISSPEANRLFKVVFGNGVTSEVLNQWSKQGLSFSMLHDMSWGLVQLRGGPCGVLAPLQALILKIILFELPNLFPPSDSLPELNNFYKNLTLVRAISEALWNAGDKKKATIAIVWSPAIDHWLRSAKTPSRETVIAEEVDCLSVATAENLFKNVRVIRTSRFQLLLEQVNCCMPVFQSNLGALLLLLSFLLSRGLDGVEEDRDIASEPLITQPFGHVSQEVVNLILTGRAVTHVFDGDQNLEGGLRLKGIPGPVEVGFLTTMEYLRYCEVGNYLKNPRWPVWVVGSESHYTVLFGRSETILQNKAPRDVRESRIQAVFDGFDYSGGGGFITKDNFLTLLQTLEIDMPESTKEELTATEFVVWGELHSALQNLEEERGGFKGMEGSNSVKEFDLFHFNGLAKFDIVQQNEGIVENRELSFRKPRLTKLKVSLPASITEASLSEFRTPPTTFPDDSFDSTAQSFINLDIGVAYKPSQYGPLVDCIRTKWRNASCSWEGDAPSLV